MHESFFAAEQVVDRGYLSVVPDGASSEQHIEWGVSLDLLNSVRLARQLVRSDRASLLLPDDDGTELRLVAAIGLPAHVIHDASIPSDDSIASIVAQQRQPLLVNDEIAFLGAVGPEAPRYREMPFISVPVPLGDARNGVLNVAAPVDRAAFQTSDLHGLQSLAALIGSTLPTFTARERLGQLEDVIGQLQRRLIQVQETERQRLARELHDEAGHALTIALLRVDLERVKSTTSPATRESLTQARDAIMGAATALNDMAFRLRPRILEDLGLLPALRTLVAQAQVPGTLRITLEGDGETPKINGNVELAVFRVVQETLTNIRKHAAARTASVRLTTVARSLILVVEDDGIGIDKRQGHEALITGLAGQGLRGMRERVEVLGGIFAIGARREGGTRVVVTLPLHPRDADDG